MKWKNCKNSEELENEYKDINIFLEEWNNKFPNIKLENISSWNAIFLAIKPFIEFLKTERYFMILNEVDNPSRADMLGLNEEILNDPKIIEPNAKFKSMIIDERILQSFKKN